MHETTITIGVADKSTPKNVQWKTLNVNDKDVEFQKYYKILSQATSRQLYILISYFDIKQSWIDNSKGKNITGLLLSANYSFSGDSSLTRTFNFEFYADGTEDTYISPSNICKFYIGLETELNLNTIVYFGLGAGVIDGPSWSYSSTQRNVSFSAIDLGCLLDGSRSGIMSQENIWKYDQDSSVRANIKNMIDFYVNTDGGYKVEYTEDSIANCVRTTGEEYADQVQNDIESSTGTTVLDMLNDIIENSLPYYVYYFDTNGLFHYSITPNADPNRYVQYTIPQNLVITENLSTNYNGRYNCIEVWGLAQNPESMNIDLIADDGYTGELICDGETHTHSTSGISVPTSQEYNEETKTYDMKVFCDRLPQTKDSLEYTGDTTWGCNIINLYDVPADADIRINLNAMQESEEDVWYNVSGTYTIGNRNIIYFCRDPEESTATSYTYWWQGAGQVEPHATAELTDGKYSVSNVGRMRYILQDEAITTDALCLTRAKWELYNYTQNQDTIQITMVPIYFVQAGHLVQYTSIRTGETDTYLVKSVSCSASNNGTMTINMVKFYTYFEE